MVCPESANFFYGEYGEYGVSRASMSNPEKPGFSFCFSIQVRSCLTRPPYSPYSLYPPFQFAKRNFFIPNSSDAIQFPMFLGWFFIFRLEFYLVSVGSVSPYGLIMHCCPCYPLFQYIWDRPRSFFCSIVTLGEMGSFQIVYKKTAFEKAVMIKMMISINRGFNLSRF